MTSDELEILLARIESFSQEYPVEFEMHMRRHFPERFPKAKLYGDGDDGALRNKF